MSYPARTDGPATSTFDPGQYPRTYRVSLKYRILMVFVGVVNMALGPICIVYFGNGQDASGLGERIGFTFLGVLFFALGLYVVTLVLKMNVILYADRIEWQGVRSTRSLTRDEIAGWRVERMAYYWTLVLLPRKPGMKNLRIMLMLKTDGAFDAWMASLQNRISCI